MARTVSMQAILRVVLAIVLVTSAAVVIDWRAQPLGLRYDGSVAVTVRALVLEPKLDSFLPLSRGWDAAARGHLDRIYTEGLYVGLSKLQYPPVSLLLIPVIEASRMQPASFFWVTGWIAFALTLLPTLLIVRDRLAAVAVAPREARRCLALVVCLAFVFYPLVKSVALGQVQTYLTAMLAWCLWLYSQGRAVAAGALVGVACWFKPHYALLALWALLAGRTAMAAAIVGAGAVGGLIGLWFFGLGPHLDYLGVLGYIGQRGESYFPNQSVNGLLNRLMSVSQPDLYNNTEWKFTFPPPNGIVRIGTIATSLLLLAVGAWLTATRMRGNTLSLAAAVLCVTLASPIAWEHHHAVLFPIGMLLLTESRERGAGFAVAAALALAVAALNLNFLNAFAHTYFNVVQSYLFFASLTLLALCWGAASAVRSAEGRPDGGVLAPSR